MAVTVSGVSANSDSKGPSATSLSKFAPHRSCVSLVGICIPLNTGVLVELSLFDPLVGVFSRLLERVFVAIHSLFVAISFNVTMRDGQE